MSRLTVEECVGGYRVAHPQLGTLVVCIQRDPHPIHGNGITWDEAKVRAEACAAALMGDAA